ncbi:MAG: PIN/TRAM domain-containing protein [Selenomonadaceae bacterium]|nr:PIN/TRAM domain-containing protein [Selenomonadaceae bacterium]
MLDKVLRTIFTLFLAITGGALLKLASPLLANLLATEMLDVDLGIFQFTVAGLICILSGALLGGLGGWFASPFLLGKLRRFTVFVEKQLGKMPTHDVIAGACGLAIGLIIANLLSYSFAKIPVVGDYIPVIFSIVLGYLGIHITIKKRRELAASFDFIPRVLKEVLRSREREAQPVEPAKPEPAKVSIVKQNKSKSRPVSLKKAAVDKAAADRAALDKANADKHYKLLDTNVIIDGRIADICRTGFLEGTLLIPVFVLEELQHIADSPDALRRVRGRRGLDVLQSIRDGSSKLEVEVMNIDFDDINGVDSKLVRLAQKVKGKIITNDFNLNKVAQLRDVEVLNINDLSNAVKAVVIPGETMRVQVVRDGREPGQGVAYLEDGTMIVIENGHRYLSRTISVEVTSALQTSAGRMIFARPR